MHVRMCTFLFPIPFLPFWFYEVPIAAECILHVSRGSLSIARYEMSFNVPLIGLLFESCVPLSAFARAVCTVQPYRPLCRKGLKLEVP